MRVVQNKDELISAIESAKRESMSSFGDQRILIEKFITNPRHVEFQIFGDKHVKTPIHFFTCREITSICSKEIAAFKGDTRK